MGWIVLHCRCCIQTTHGAKAKRSYRAINCRASTALIRAKLVR